MKLYERIILLIVLLLFSGPGLFAQNTRTIDLYVDVAALNGDDAYGQGRFNGQQVADSREFLVQVDPGDTIVWRGFPTSGESRILIRQIVHAGNDNVFERNVLRDTRNEPGVVRGVIQPGTEGFLMKYKLMFQVEGDGRPGNRMYKIDPKLQVKTAR